MNETVRESHRAGPIAGVGSSMSSAGLALASFVLGIIGGGTVFLVASSFADEMSLLLIFLIVPAIGLLAGSIAWMRGREGAGRTAELATAGIVLAAVTALVAVLLYVEIDNEFIG